MARVLDEVQKAGVGFAHSNGWVWGGFATILLLMLPPVMNWLIDTVGDSPHFSRIAGDHRFPRRGDGGVPNHRAAITMAFFFGATLVMVIQMLAVVVFSVIWLRRMGGTGERA